MPRHGLRKIPDRTDMPGPFIVRGQRHGPCKTPEKRCGGSKMHECHPRNTPEHWNNLCKMPRHRRFWRPSVGAIKVATLLDEIACCGIAILFQAEVDCFAQDLAAPLHSGAYSSSLRGVGRPSSPTTLAPAMARKQEGYPTELHALGRVHCEISREDVGRTACSMNSGRIP
jgi:hypothetical protein